MCVCVREGVNVSSSVEGCARVAVLDYQVFILAAQVSVWVSCGHMHPCVCVCVSLKPTC